MSHLHSDGAAEKSMIAAIYVRKKREGLGT
jgi:hypothetical protein